MLRPLLIRLIGAALLAAVGATVSPYVPLGLPDPYPPTISPVAAPAGYATARR